MRGPFFEKMPNLLKDAVGSWVYKDVKTIDMIENNMLGKDGLTITSANHLANIATCIPDNYLTS